MAERGFLASELIAEIMQSHGFDLGRAGNPAPTQHSGTTRYIPDFGPRPGAYIRFEEQGRRAPYHPNVIEGTAREVIERKELASGE